MKNRGVTIVELCFVILIVAVLAAVAVPNLQLAGTRAKISRVQSDFSTIKTAVESYRIDANVYPQTNEAGTTPTVLSTPIAYLAIAQFPDPLYKKSLHGQANDDNQWLRYNAWVDEEKNDVSASYHLRRYGNYWMYSNAPFIPVPQETVSVNPLITSLVPYDTTNGTISSGRLIRGML